MYIVAGRTLRDDSVVVNEWRHTPYNQSVRYTIGGRKIIERRIKFRSRDFDVNSRWITNDDLIFLTDLRDSAANSFIVTLPDGRVFNMTFRHDEADPVSVTPVEGLRPEYDEDHFFDVTLKLTQV